MIEPIVLNLGGEQKIWHMNNYALVELSKLCDSKDPLGVSNAIMQIANEDVLQAITYIVHAGLIGYQKSEANFNHGLQIKDVAKVVANADDNQMIEVWEAFKKATGISDFLANLETEPTETSEKKKKSASKKSQSTP